MRDALRYPFVPKPAISSKQPSVTGKNSRLLFPEKTPVRHDGAPTRAELESAEPGGLPLLILFYAAIWLATWAIAHVQPGLALGVGAAFVIVPGIYLLARVRIERVALLLHPGRRYRG